MLAVKMPRKETIVVVEEPVPVPGEGEVLIKMKASALCRSDMHAYHRTMFEFDDDFNITPGHEPCGIVDKLGPNVTAVKEGDRVAVFLAIGCGKCQHCKDGDIVLCKDLKMISRDRNGAHADYLVVPQECCLSLPDGMDFVTGALSTDVGGTLYTACKRLGVDDTKTVTIFGVGPMGMGGLLVANHLGAKVIAVDGNEERLVTAKELGATHVINCMNVNSVEAIRSITGEGSDVSIVCVGSEKAINDALDSTCSKGKVGLIGEINESKFSPSLQLMRKHLEVMGCWYFNLNDWEEIANFMVEKKVPMERISSKSYRLKDAVEAFTLFDSGKTQKVVFVWD